ncbi:response regulator [Halobacteriovorax sp. GB3]|uniref:response regulator n=1 Tax=Halobacteriovorax sp. GB3 TaxID=2719615 RepID=UPI00235DDE39|nr:response regulator [Halobacteriovorax sp. GB3]MDD0853494.1 response regulator [Halobacteriovorax sp. GB3]
MSLNKKAKTILVVDDDPDLRVFFHKILTNMGHEVFEAENTTDAANMVDKIVPHLIFLDINLDHEKGYLLLEKLKTIDKFRRIKVIMVTASTAKKDIALSKKYGVSGYLVKPVTNNQLLTLMRKMGPKLLYPSYIIPEMEESLHVTARCSGALTKINETSFKYNSKVKFNQQVKLDINSDFFSELNIKHAQFQIFEPSKSLSPGIYESTVQLIGLSDKDMIEIRKIKTKKV